MVTEFNVTAANGDECTIHCTTEVFADKLIAILEQAGAKYNTEVETWDFGFYNKENV